MRKHRLWISIALLLALTLLPLNGFALVADSEEGQALRTDDSQGLPLLDAGAEPDRQHIPGDPDPAEGADVPSTFSIASYDLSYVRVLLSTATNDVSVTFRGNYVLTENGTNKLLLQSESTYIFRVAGSNVSVYNSRGNTLLYRSSGASIAINECQPPANMGYNYFILCNSEYGALDYKGDLYCHSTGSTLQMVNRIYIEEYLKGVVGNEIGNSSPTEAQKAQAIIARNYALNEIRSDAYTYDVLDTSQSQVYKGVCADMPAAAAAVDATAALVGRINGSRIPMFYSSSNGGQVNVSYMHWNGTANSYEAMKDDPYDKAYIKSYYNNASMETPTRYYEEVTLPKVPGSATSNTYVKTLVEHKLLPALQSNGTGIFSASQISVTSLTITANCTSPRTYIDSLTLSFSGTANSTAFSGITATVADTELYVSNGYGFFKNGNLQEYWLVDNGSTYTIQHARRGHGVGMSQVGAMEMAKNHAMTAAQILQFYYTGLTVSAENGIRTKDALPALPSAVGLLKLPATRTAVFASANSSAQVIYNLAAETPVLVKGTSGEWTQISVNGITGYVPTAVFTPVFTHVVVGNMSVPPCSIRNDSGSKIGSATNGDTFELDTAYITSDWHKVKCDITYGNIHYSTGRISILYAMLRTAAQVGLEPEIPTYAVHFTLPSGYEGATSIEIDGIPYTGTLSGSTLTVQLPAATAKLAVMAKKAAVSPVYPTGMAVWQLTFSSGAYTAQQVSELSDVLAYKGCSLRILGQVALRARFGVSTSTLAALKTSAGLGGYTLAEMGTLYAAVPAGTALTLDIPNATIQKATSAQASGGFETFLANATPVAGLRTAYTLRGYMKLIKNGVTYTLYAPPVTRSVYDVACQALNANEYTTGSDGYRYLQALKAAAEAGA